MVHQFPSFLSISGSAIRPVTEYAAPLPDMQTASLLACSSGAFILKICVIFFWASFLPDFFGGFGGSRISLEWCSIKGIFIFACVVPGIEDLHIRHYAKVIRKLPVIAPFMHNASVFHLQLGNNIRTGSERHTRQFNSEFPEILVFMYCMADGQGGTSLF